LDARNSAVNPWLAFIAVFVIYAQDYIGWPTDWGWQKGRKMDILELQDNATRACDMLKVMANQARLMILCHLLDGEKNVQQLQGFVGLSQSALSQQLAILRGQSLVKTRREAQSVFYSLSSPEAETLIATLYHLYCAKDLPQ
jgi:ArsR family transcriptional regulator, virulence genes transcriptional regulator